MADGVIAVLGSLAETVFGKSRRQRGLMLALFSLAFLALTIWATAVTTVPIGFILIGLFSLGLSIGIVMMITPGKKIAPDAD